MDSKQAVKNTAMVESTGRRDLSLLSFNIQTGVETQDFHEYVT